MALDRLTPRDVKSRHIACLASGTLRTYSYTFPWIAAFLLVAGCSEDPDSLTGGRPYSGDPGTANTSADESEDEETSPSPPTSPPPPADPTFGERALARAREWIAAEMPYCGGPNGGKDVICGGTCVREGDAKKPEWDKYRSDCSGFVSWSWGLAPPGVTTSTLAPYDSSDSTMIPVSELAVGDALNGKGHVMLWGGWVDESAGTARILQESRCGQIAHEKIARFTKIDATTLKSSDGRNFHPIRYRGDKSEALNASAE